MAALKYWVWLTTLPGLGERAKLQLLAHFGSPEEIYFAPEGELLLAEGITKLQAALLADKSLDRAEKVLEDCARDGQFLLTMDDAGYPARLRNIYDPPLLLYGKGSLPLFDDEVAVTVVGTRDCTPYGVRAASQLGYELARQGALLVSGMAKGIDGEALKGACAPAALPPRCWAAARTWCIRRPTAGCMRTSPPPASSCRSTRPGRNPRATTSRCGTDCSVR